jgi:ArsR family transcriptional regulator, lead/cadmium/zinc/bismuth-responsive transcriptional repressor
MSSSDLPDCDGEEHLDHSHAARSRGELERAARMCAAMGDPERLRILGLLLEGTHCVSELMEETSDSMSLVSQRLKILAGADLVGRRRQGRHVYYSLRDDHVRQMVANLFSHSHDNHP